MPYATPEEVEEWRQQVRDKVAALGLCLGDRVRYHCEGWMLGEPDHDYYGTIASWHGVPQVRLDRKMWTHGAYRRYVAANAVWVKVEQEENKI